jgi:hypothetical protein
VGQRLDRGLADVVSIRSLHIMKAIDWAFRSRETGRIAIVQWPNVTLIVFVVARGLDGLVDPGTPWSTVLNGVGTVAIVWWSVDELVRGVNPWRRLVGAGVLVLQVVALVR